jgi:uncharacterized membrane protein (DUF2068 family)
MVACGVVAFRQKAPRSVRARPRGASLIIAYKLTKALVQATLAAVIGGLTLSGLGAHIADFAMGVHETFTGAWAQTIARVLFGASSHLWLVVFALALDAILSSIEGWSLYRGLRWGPWLVIVATSALIPFEIVELVRNVALGRVAVLFVNLAILVYLGRRARRPMQPQRLPGPSPKRRD